MVRASMDKCPRGNKHNRKKRRRNQTIPMKSKTLITAFVTLIAALGFGVLQAKEKDQAKLAATAKVTKEQAEKTALEKVPNGTIKEAELENEKGKLIWSFDIAKPGTTDTTEVNVDAISGAIVSVEVETAKDEAKEEKSGKKKEAK
jgi:uncharacterized membrane protein YkoI